MPDDDRPSATLPSHPDLQISHSETVFERHLRLDVVRFRNRLFSGGWSGERVYDVVRRGTAISIVLYDPERDCVVLVEQFRLAPLYTGHSPWQTETVAGLVEPGEMPAAVARREAREEADLALIGEPILIQYLLPAAGTLDEDVALFCGRVDASRAGGIHGLAAEHEDIRVVVKSIAEIEAMLDAGAIEAAHALVGLYWLLRHRERLRLLWGAA